MRIAIRLAVVAMAAWVDAAASSQAADTDVAPGWLDSLHGRWTTIATHHFDDGTTLVEHGTYTAGRFGHVVQTSTRLSGTEATLSATIPWRSGRTSIRSHWRKADGELVYRNETEEAPARWRFDFEERWRRAASRR
jgi:hypothetical protein